MADAAALVELGEVLLWVGAFILASLAYYIARAVASGLRHIPLIGGALASVTAGIEGYIVEPLDDVRKASEAGITRGLSGLADSLAVLVGLAALLGLGVKAALTYMWNTALEVRVAKWIANEVAKLDIPHIHLPSLTSAIARDVEAALRPEIAAARNAAAAAKSFATAAVNAGVRDAERYADQAVGALRDAEDAAVAEAVRIARAGAGDVTAATNAAIAAAEGIAIPIGREVGALDDYIKGLGLGGLIAAVPALGLLVHTIAVEAGLDSADCRAKHKEICSVPASDWTNLLGGLAAIGFAFSLRELYDVAEPLTRELAPLIAKAA